MSIARAVIEFVANTQGAVHKITEFGQKVQNSATGMKNNFKKVADGLTAMGGNNALKEIYNQTKKLSDFSKSFSLPINEVSKFNNILSLFGGSADEGIEGLKSVQQAIIDFKTTGSGALKNVSAQIGLSLTNADGSMKNSMQVIEGLRQKFKGLSQSAQLKVAQELGLASPATLQMLRASDAEYAKMKQTASGMVTVNESTSQKVQNLSRIIAKMKADWYGVGVVVLDMVLPIIKKLSDLMTSFNGQSELTKKIVVGITGAFMVFGAVIPIIMKLANVFSLLVPIMKIVWALFVANPVGLMITAVLGLSVAIVALIKNWEKVKSVMSGAWDKFKGWFGFGSKKDEEKQDEMKPLPTSAEISSVQNANTYNSNVAQNNQNSNTTRNNNVNNNFVIKVDSEDMANKVNSVVRQSASGVY